MDQEYPFRPRGKHGFDRDDVINYISQAQLRCNEHLAHMEELEAAKNAWYTQAKSMEREKAALVARNRELEEQLERGAVKTDDWFPQPESILPPFSATETAELAALKSRCLELDQVVSEQNALRVQQEQALEQQKEITLELERHCDEMRAAKSELEQALLTANEINQGLQSETQSLGAQLQALEADKQALEAEKTALQAELARCESEQEEALPRFTLHQQEIEDMRAKLDQQTALVQSYANRIAALEQERAAQLVQLDALEDEKSAYASQLPGLQQQLAQLAQSAEQITTLEAVKAALSEELEAAKAQLEAAAQNCSGMSEQAAALQREKSELNQRNIQLAQAEALGRQKLDSLGAELDGLRAKIAELEARPMENSEETLRSMVLSSFNYSNLYVDNNLKTAQFISEATSRNIGHVSDSAKSLLEQVEAISRGFNDTTDNIRRSLAAFQRELGSIQTGLNRRLSKDRFQELLEENEKLRARLESELLAELSSEEDEAPATLPLPEGANGAPQLPFAEDLPQSYHSYLGE